MGFKFLPVRDGIAVLAWDVLDYLQPIHPTKQPEPKGPRYRRKMLFCNPRRWPRSDPVHCGFTATVTGIRKEQPSVLDAKKSMDQVELFGYAIVVDNHGDFQRVPIISVDGGNYACALLPGYRVIRVEGQAECNYGIAIQLGKGEQ